MPLPSFLQPIEFPDVPRTLDQIFNQAIQGLATARQLKQKDTENQMALGHARLAAIESGIDIDALGRASPEEVSGGLNPTAGVQLTPLQQQIQKFSNQKEAMRSLGIRKQEAEVTNLESLPGLYSGANQPASPENPFLIFPGRFGPQIRPNPLFQDRFLSTTEQQAFGVPAGTKFPQVKGQIPMAPERREKLAQFEQAIPILDNLEREVLKLGLGKTTSEATITGARLKASSLFPSTPPGVYQAQLEAFLTQLSRAAGERGVVTDQDVERIKKNIPGFFDTEESARKKIGSLKYIFGEIKKRSQSAFVGSPFKATETPSSPAQSKSPQRNEDLKSLSTEELLKRL